MKIKNIDHFVITTGDLKKCLHFYVDLLGMKAVKSDGRYALYFGDSKFNIHTQPAQFLPAAEKPTAGSLDFCLNVAEDIEEIRQEMIAKHYPIVDGPVTRHGARGEMKSLYLRDPDGNLVELCHYEEE